METSIDMPDARTRPEIGCPQCGAAIRMPHSADFIRCASCGSILVLAQGVLLHVLRERVCVTREQAPGILQAWLKKQGFESALAPVVGELQHFPFLRVKREDDEHVAPLEALPSPALAQLASAPTEMIESPDPLEGMDWGVLDAAIGAALTDPATKSVQVEVRAYYPAKYALGREVPTWFSALVGAGQGPVYPDALPARSGVFTGSLQWYLLGLAVVLVAEAWAVPGLLPALLAIVATAVAFGAVALLKGFRRE